jgi:adenylosuccinate synthase
VDDVVLGLQWGDEGKGKLCDELAPARAAVIRFQGGANAGHTIVQNGTRHVLHQIPAGALHPGVRCIIGAGCVVEPVGLRREAEAIGLGPDRLVVASRAQIVLPWYPAVDAAEERLREVGAVGTTGRGIGPAYAAKAGRWGITAGELADPGALRQRLPTIAPWHHRWLQALRLPAPDWQLLHELGAWLRPYVADDLAAIAAAKRAGSVLFEGQLGLMRDPDRGMQPLVTGASLLPPAALAGGARILGVAKPYVTMVGGGFFPTEAEGADADVIRERGEEYGATTGRPRRCGWLDLPALRYAVRATGATHLAMQMKCDGLAALGRMPVCVAYADWDEARGYPLPHELPSVRPVYEDWGPPGDPVALARRIADAVGLPLLYVGTGPGRGEARWLRS